MFCLKFTNENLYPNRQIQKIQNFNCKLPEYMFYAITE